MADEIDFAEESSTLTSSEWHVVWRYRVDGLPMLAKNVVDATSTEAAVTALDELEKEVIRTRAALAAKHRSDS